MARGLQLFVNIGARLNSSLGSAARGAERQMSAMTRSMKLQAAEVKAAWAGAEGAAGSFGRNFRNMAFQASAPAAGLVSLGMRAEYSWQQAGNALEAALDLGAAGKKARKEIEAIARSLPGNSAENLSAAVDLARTGFNAEAIERSLKTTVMLAKSDPDSVDNKAASDIMTNVMLGMRMKETEANAKRIANLLAYGANKSSSDVRLMGESFKYAAPLASRLGLSAEQLTGIFMTMADAGIKGSESGVALRSGMVRLLKPTLGARAVLARHNMKITDYVTLTKQATGESIVNSLKANGIAAEAATAQIQAALNDPNLSGENLTARLADIVASAGGQAASAMDRELLANIITEAMMSGASKVDILKFMQDAQKKFTEGDLVNFFDVRQGARLATLLDGRLNNNVNAATNLSKGFLDRSFAAQQQGIVGGWQRMIQSFGAVLGELENAGVFDAIANGMFKLADAISNISKNHPGLIKNLAIGLVAIAGLGGLGMILGGIGSGLGVIWTVLKFMGPALLRFPLAALDKVLGLFFRIGPMGGAALTRFGTMFARVGPLLLAGLRTLGPLLLRGLGAALGVLSGPVGWAILAASAIALAWQFRDEIAKGFTAAWDWIKNTAWPALRDTITSIDWAGIGMTIADSLTFGLASRLPALTGTVKNWASNIGGGSKPPTPPGRASGGTVNGGHLYRINEHGQELFAPGQSGTIIPAAATAALIAAANGNAPAAAMGGGITVGEIHIHGANDPVSTQRIVREELRRLANSQRRALHD